MISVITWLWQTAGYRSQFLPEHVNTLRRQVARHYSEPHRFICVTDLLDGFDPEVELVADRRDFASIPSPHGGGNPSCYRRLRLFDPGAAADFGERFVSIDLDTVIVGDLRPLWDRPDDFVIWRDPIHRNSYCGSMMMVRAGSRPQVWHRFDPGLSPRESLKAGCRGSDQGWIRYCLGLHEATWTREDGVYSYRMDLHSGRDRLPGNARIIMFHGRPKPWDYTVDQNWYSR
jgi:hypothetical protein